MYACLSATELSDVIDGESVVDDMPVVSVVLSDCVVASDELDAESSNLLDVVS